MIFRGAIFLLGLALVPAFGGRTEEAVREEKIEARVNDRVLTTTELQRRLAPLYSQYEDSIPFRDLPGQKEKARGDAINGWIDEQLMLIEVAGHEEIQADPIEVEREFRQNRLRFPSEEFFLKALQEEGLDEEKYKNRIAEQIKMQGLLYREVYAKVNVSPGEVIAYYHDHPEEFRSSAEVRFSIIMIPAPAEEGEKRDKARSRAEEVMEKIRSGEDFGVLAGQYSSGPNSAQGGDMGYIGEDDLLPELSRVLSGLPVEADTGIIETPGGFRIIKITGLKEATSRSLQEVWQAIHEQLHFLRRRALQEEWLSGLREKAFIQVGQ